MQCKLRTFEKSCENEVMENTKVKNDSISNITLWFILCFRS